MESYIWEIVKLGKLNNTRPVIKGLNYDPLPTKQISIYSKKE